MGGPRRRTHPALGLGRRARLLAEYDKYCDPRTYDEANLTTEFQDVRGSTYGRVASLSDPRCVVTGGCLSDAHG